MAMAYKRVGTQKGFHHVRVATAEDCQCGDYIGTIDAGSNATQKFVCYDEKLDEFLQITLTLAVPSVVVIMAAVVSGSEAMGRFDIQRPIGTSVLDQETVLSFGGDGCDTEPALIELEACEELPAGTYTWYLFALQTTNVYAAWIKAHAVS